MKFVHSLRGTLEPLSISIIAIISFCLLFTSLYVLVLYQNYLKNYQSSQANEVEKIQQETEGILSEIRHLLESTEKRIRPAGRDPKRIQAIINSASSLSSNPRFPKIQKFSYYKFSDKPMVITRFGATFLSSNIKLEEGKIQKDPSIHYEENIILGHHQIFDDQGQMIGTLEIQFELADLRESLGKFSKVLFNSQSLLTAQEPFISTGPFLLYLKNPDTFWSYIASQKSHFAIFCFFAVLCLILLALSAQYFNRFYQKHYADELFTLKDKMNRLLDEQQEHHYHHISCQSQRRIYSDYIKQQREQASYLSQSLAIAENSFKDSFIELSNFECLSLIQSWRKEIQSVEKGSLSVLKNEPIDLKNLLDEMQLFFTEKINKSNLTLEITCNEEVTFNSDPTFIEFILINLIGKSLYKAPKGSVISVFTTDDNDIISLEIKSSVFLPASSAEKLIKKSLDLFLPDDFLVNTCQEHGLKYEQSKIDKEISITKITFPNNQEEKIHDNVVQLFK